MFKRKDKWFAEKEKKKWEEEPEKFGRNTDWKEEKKASWGGWKKIEKKRKIKLKIKNLAFPKDLSHEKIIIKTKIVIEVIDAFPKKERSLK